MKKMKNTRLIFLLAAMLCVCGCSARGEAQSSQSAAPTPTPVVTIDPTAPPELPSADPALPSFREVLELPRDEWPERCRMQFLHSSGNNVDTPGELTQGDGLCVYLLSGLTEKAFDRFILEEGRIYPRRNKLLDTGEGITVRASSGDAETALTEAIAQCEQEGYYLVKRDDIATVWNGLYGFTEEPERGAIAYPGEFAVLDSHDGYIRRIFSLRANQGVYIADMKVREPGSEPQMFHYLCSMLASLRFFSQ